MSELKKDEKSAVVVKSATVQQGNQQTCSLCCTIGVTMGSNSSAKTVESTSRPAALHFRKFHRLTSSPSSSLSFSVCPCALDLHQIHSVSKVISMLQVQRPIQAMWKWQQGMQRQTHLFHRIGARICGLGVSEARQRAHFGLKGRTSWSFSSGCAVPARAASSAASASDTSSSYSS